MSNHDPLIPEVVIPEVVRPDNIRTDSVPTTVLDQPVVEEWGTDPDDPPVALTVEDLIDQLERVTRERDGHFDARARLQAEFDNYRKRMTHQHTELIERAAESLVGKLLPVLDACDAAMALSVAGAEPIAAQLAGVLERRGWPASRHWSNRSTPRFTRPSSTSRLNPLTVWNSPSWSTCCGPATNGEAGSSAQRWSRCGDRRR